MNKKHLIWIIPILIFFGTIVGIFISNYVDNYYMEDYDLYNCIYNNADINNFNQHPEMIKIIQDECVCFRENNYTNMMQSKC